MVTRYARMFDLLWHLLEYETEPITLTAWGREVGLRRTPYLTSLVNRLIEWGAVEVIENYRTVRGLQTRGYTLSDRPAAFFNEVLDTIAQAVEDDEKAARDV